jgi:hypothetical protein
MYICLSVGSQFNEYREVLDPANILGNEWVDTLLGPAGK